MLPRCFFVVLASIIPAIAADADRVAQSAQTAPTRWINPLPLPNYPVGKLVRDMPRGAPDQVGGLWLVDHAEQYRQLADPTALWY